MAAEAFVDTSAWYPILVARHPDHAALAAALREHIKRRRRVVTTNLVVAETHALVLRRAGRAAALTFVRTVHQSPNLVVTSTPELEEAAVRDWLTPFEDHDLSFADAVSFAVMRSRKITEALALDHHFTVAGFSVIPSV